LPEKGKCPNKDRFLVWAGSADVLQCAYFDFNIYIISYTYRIQTVIYSGSSSEVSEFG
jgi:hypothetical protein